MIVMKHILALLTFTCTIFSQPLFPVHDNNGEARDRTYDVVHYKIEVLFDEAHKKIFGTTTIMLVPFLSRCTTVEFDAENMEFRSATIGKKPLAYETKSKSVVITLDKPYSFLDTIIVAIEYIATPKKGLYFVQPDSGYPDKPRQIWTQGEDMDNHHWFPCYDFPNDKATSEVIGTVKSSYTFLSNGKLIGVKENKKTGAKTFHWKQNKPHASYLIMLAAGHYTVLKDSADGIPLEYYIYPGQREDAAVCLSHTPKIMKFFNERIGYKYPWEKYAQVAIADFMFGGMENTSATTMLDRILVYDARSRVDESPASLIAHELAHQWWGDVVTCKDWRHLWINESFASYFDLLYFEYRDGRDEFTNSMYSSQQAGITTDKTLGRKPIVSVGSHGGNVYARGASVLHMLRFLLGDELFFRALKHFITKHQFQPVETDDLKTAIEEATGQNLYWFFDQWVYKAGYPVFDVSYTYSDSSGTIALSVKQTQTLDSLTGIFRTPVDVEIVTAGGSTTHRINLPQRTRESMYTIAAGGEPKLVQFDKDHWILKEVHYTRSRTEWAYAAEFASDAVERKTAMQKLGSLEKPEEFIPLFIRAANRDPFWAVRQEAVNRLGSLHSNSDEILSVLINTAMNDPKSSVRNMAAEKLGSYKTKEASATLRRLAYHDSSYSVEASAVLSLANVDSNEAMDVIRSKLDVWSYGNKVSNAALNALAKLDSVEAVNVAITKVRYGAEPLGRNTALTILKKHGSGRRDVLDAVVPLLNDKTMKNNAASALGDIGDESVLPILEKIARDKTDPAFAAAETSVMKIKKRSKE